MTQDLREPEIPDPDNAVIDVHNPVEVERAIRETANRIAKGVRITMDLFAKYRRAETAYEVAYAKAFRGYHGPQYEKKYEAVLATQEEREAKDDAEIMYKFADRKMSALEDELRGWQSINKSVSGMWNAAGTGRV